MKAVDRVRRAIHRDNIFVTWIGAEGRARPSRSARRRDGRRCGGAAHGAEHATRASGRISLRWRASPMPDDTPVTTTGYTAAWSDVASIPSTGAGACTGDMQYALRRYR
jgi:hypothetical protein